MIIMAIVKHMFLLGKEIISYTLVQISVPSPSFCLNICYSCICNRNSAQTRMSSRTKWGQEDGGDVYVTKKSTAKLDLGAETMSPRCTSLRFLSVLAHSPVGFPFNQLNNSVNRNQLLLSSSDSKHSEFGVIGPPGMTRVGFNFPVALYPTHPA